MSEKDELVLNCWVAGTNRKLYFEVRVSANARISDLRKEIYNKNESFMKTVGLIGLSLQRVSVDIGTFLREKSWDFKPAEFVPSIELVGSTSPLSTHWQSQPPLTTLHVILRTTTKPIRTKEALKQLQDYFICRPEALSMDYWVQETQMRKALNQFDEILRIEIRRFLSNRYSTRWERLSSGAEEGQPLHEESKAPLFDDELKRLLPTPDSTSKLKVEKLLSDRGPKIWSNPSDDERTKVLFEALCKHWGFYFRFIPTPNGIGAADLPAFVNTLPSFPEWKDDIFRDNENLQGDKELMRSEISNESRRNESIVDGGLAKLFFARTVVFRTFIEVFKEMNGNSLYGRAKFEWLLFQILPTVRINHMDPFTALVDFCLEEVNYELLASLQSEFSIYEPLRDSGHDIESFLCVLDEAQDADTRYMGAFSDPGGFFRSPVLLPIARFMTNSNFLRVIVAGSEISPDSLTYTRRPKVGLPNFFSWVRNL